jgi:Skp family chaperone for outer membrane proteins
MFRKKEELQFQSDAGAADVPRAATQEELQAQREEELARLQQELESLSGKLTQMESETLKYNREAALMHQKADAILAALQSLGESNALRRRVSRGSPTSTGHAGLA